MNIDLHIFQSRRVKVGIFTCAVLAAGYFVLFNRSDDLEEKKQSKLPPLPTESMWNSDFEESKIAFSSNGNPSFGAEDEKRGSEPFRLPSEAKKQKEPKLEKELISEIQEPEPLAFEPLPSLLKSRRGVEASAEKNRPPLPKPEEQNRLRMTAGSLLYCQLLEPLSSLAPNSMVRARLSQSHPENGQDVFPQGTELLGLLESVKGGRLYLSNEWQVRMEDGSSVSIQAVAQDAGFDLTEGLYTSNDGQAGFATTAVETESGDGKQLLGKIASAVGRASQDRLRTVFGEQIPITQRNLILESAASIVEHQIGKLDEGRRASLQEFRVEAGRDFYLMLTGDSFE
ncbi:hypothetical protein AAFN60_19210 [Roseibacillus persicicus]|uniref:hypothetical protein n=1 Tax=Roseibacillus persicicus TaxID=454148 RepID=UPI00398ADD5D